MIKKMKCLTITYLAMTLGLAIWLSGSLVPAQAQMSIPQAVATQCAGDIKKHCGTVTPGGGRVVACLYAHNDKITPECAYTVYISGEVLTATIAALRRLATSTSCRSDLAQYCRGIPAGGGRLYSCLESKKATLTKGCRAALPEARALLTRAGLLR